MGENLELKERFESKMGTIKKLEEQKLLEIENLKTLEVLLVSFEMDKFSHQKKENIQREKKISELEACFESFRKELHNKQKDTEKLKSTFEEKLLKRENAITNLALEKSELKIASNNLKAENITMKEKQLKQEDANKCLKLENSEVKKASNDLKVENRTVKEEILKQNLEISELKEKLESNKEIIKKLREQNKGLLSNMVKNNSTIHNVSSKNGDSCFTSNSKKAQDKKQQEQDKEKKDHGNHVTPSLKLHYNNNSLYGYQLSN